MSFFDEKYLQSFFKTMIGILLFLVVLLGFAFLGCMFIYMLLGIMEWFA